MLKFQFDLTDLDEFTNTIGEIKSSLSLKLLDGKQRQIKELLGKAAERTIDRQAFPPLTKGYEARKARLFPGANKILIASGKMLEGLRTGSSFDFSFTDNRTIEIGLNDPKARGHQAGVARTNLPERHVIEPDDQLADELTEIYANEIEQELIRKLGEI